MTIVRCEFSSCKHNRDGVCTAIEILLDKWQECIVIKGKEELTNENE